MRKGPAPQEDIDWFDAFGEDENKEDALSPAARRRAHQARMRGEKLDPQEKKRGTGTKRKDKRKGPAAETTESDRQDAGQPVGKGKRKGPRRRRSFKESLARLLAKIAVIAIAIYVLTQIVGGVFVAHDNNMFPAVRDGDLCITFRLGGYYNGDVVAFEQDGMTTFGRVVGIPGDVIDITEETGLMVNGMTPYEVVYYKTKPQDPAVTYPYTVQDGEWFVLCDQREDAPDSRTFGGVTAPKGKIVLQLRRRGF